jgi:hypothetical protein
MGFLVSNKRIEPNLEKVQVILSITHFQLVKEVQCLIEILIALNWFIGRLEEHTLPFFKALRNITNLEWTLDCQKTFELKIHISSLKILS